MTPPEGATPRTPTPEGRRVLVVDDEESLRFSLGKALRRHLGLKKGRKAATGIVEVKCLGICPKGAVTVIDGADPHSWKLVAKGADLDDVVETLGLQPR